MPRVIGAVGDGLERPWRLLRRPASAASPSRTRPRGDGGLGAAQRLLEPSRLSAARPSSASSRDPLGARHRSPRRRGRRPRDRAASRPALAASAVAGPTPSRRDAADRAAPTSSSRARPRSRAACWRRALPSRARRRPRAGAARRPALRPRRARRCARTVSCNPVGRYMVRERPAELPPVDDVTRAACVDRRRHATRGAHRDQHGEGRRDVAGRTASCTRQRLLTPSRSSSVGARACDTIAARATGAALLATRAALPRTA